MLQFFRLPKLNRNKSRTAVYVDVRSCFRHLLLLLLLYVMVCVRDTCIARVYKGPRRLDGRLRRSQKIITRRLSYMIPGLNKCWCKRWNMFPHQKRVVWQGRIEIEIETSAASAVRDACCSIAAV